MTWTFLYPPQRSCRGVYWFHHVCPSIRLKRGQYGSAQYSDVNNNVPPDNFHDIISAHTAQKYKYNQEETLKDRYNTSKHCPFYHKDVPNGFNIYLAEQYINPVLSSANIYYWLRIHKHH
jgi:hypothetical protein